MFPLASMCSPCQLLNNPDLELFYYLVRCDFKLNVAMGTTERVFQQRWVLEGQFLH